MLHIFVYAHTCLYTYFHIYLHAYSSLHFYIHTTYTIPAQCIHNPIPYHTTNTIPYIQTSIHTHTYTLTIYIYIFIYLFIHLPFHVHMYIYIYTIMLTRLSVFRFLTPPLRLELAHGNPKLRHSRHDAVVADSTSQHCWEEHDLPPQKPGPQNKVNRVDGSEMVCVLMVFFVLR